uniref:P-loop containing nucleoside triphosphate hydrolase n=1 Tax=Heterorhabditis bacteriophora TaxID=37862 RepID=A0A1I7XLP8_HETBA
MAHQALNRVNPVFANFDAGETLEIVITRLAGPRKPDKLVVCTASNENGTDARQTFLRKDILISTTIVPQLTS